MKRAKLTPEQKRALEAYKFAEKQEDRYFFQRMQRQYRQEWTRVN